MSQRLGLNVKEFPAVGLDVKTHTPRSSADMAAEVSLVMSYLPIMVVSSCVTIAQCLQASLYRDAMEAADLGAKSATAQAPLPPPSS
jgi:hypothetical protein